MNDSLNDSLAAAYRVVYEDIMKTPLYNGKEYDHEHADPMFIAGINSLREFIRKKGKESRVVRCEDCIHRDKNYCRYYHIYIWLDGFCGKGEEQ